MQIITEIINDAFHILKEIGYPFAVITVLLIMLTIMLFPLALIILSIINYLGGA